MLSFSLHRPTHRLRVLSFTSTVFLRPIIDALLTDVPPSFHAELHLGLQEALVNAARHGNQLDPSKIVRVQCSITPERHLWVITDEGGGFNCRKLAAEDPTQRREYTHMECGRGLLILRQIFDEVTWNVAGNELRLCKFFLPNSRSIFD